MINTVVDYYRELLSLYLKDLKRRWIKRNKNFRDTMLLILLLNYIFVVDKWHKLIFGKL